MANAVFAALPNHTAQVSSSRVLCGGSGYNTASFARPGFRLPRMPAERFGFCGFRPVFVAQDYLTAAVPVGPPVQPAPPNRATSSESYRVSRGGSWDFDRGMVRAGERRTYAPDDRSFYVGFRPVFIADEFIGVNVPIAQIAQAAPASPPPPPPPPPTTPSMTNIVDSSNYKEFYLKKPDAVFRIDPAIRTAILNSQRFVASGTTFYGRTAMQYYFGSMFAPIHDQDNYFYLTDLVGQSLKQNNPYGPTIFGWTGNYIPILKTGHLDSYEMEYQNEYYIRAHSPGTKSFIPGIGTNVYSTGAITALFRGMAGIHSMKGSRSDAAGEFWKRAVETGLADEIGFYEFLPAIRVIKSPLYVRYPGMETVLDLPGRAKKYFRAIYPSSNVPNAFGYDDETVGVSPLFDVAPEIRKLRAEMLSRAVFAINDQSVQRVYGMLQALGIQSEMDLFRSRPEVNGTQGLAGLRHKRMPPLSVGSQKILNGLSNPY